MKVRLAIIASLFGYLVILTGCLWSTFHLKGEIDAEGPIPKEEQPKEPLEIEA